MQISETVKRFITDKVTEIYKTKYEATTKKERLMEEIEIVQNILAEEAEDMILVYLRLKYPDIAEYIKANRLYIKFDADIYYNYNSVAIEEEIKAEFKQRFAQSRSVIDIREKYYKEYSRFLTQKQIKKMYELERQSMDRIMKHQNGPGGRQMQKKK